MIAIIQEILGLEWWGEGEGTVSTRFNIPDGLNVGYNTQEPRKDVSATLVEMQTWRLYRDFPESPFDFFPL